MKVLRKIIVDRELARTARTDALVAQRVERLLDKREAGGWSADTSKLWLSYKGNTPGCGPGDEVSITSSHPNCADLVTVTRAACNPASSQFESESVLHVRLAQLAEASRLEREGSEFESLGGQNCAIAQLAERLPVKKMVPGSIPGSTANCIAGHGVQAVSKAAGVGSIPTRCAMVPSSSGLRRSVVSADIVGSNPIGTALGTKRIGKQPVLKTGAP